MSDLKLQPLFKRIIVERDTPEIVTKGGIIIPERAKEKQLFATVIKIGDEVTKVKENDRVLIEKYTGDDLAIDGKEYLVITEESIIGKVI